MVTKKSNRASKTPGKSVLSLVVAYEMGRSVNILVDEKIFNVVEENKEYLFAGRVGAKGQYNDPAVYFNSAQLVK